MGQEAAEALWAVARRGVLLEYPCFCEDGTPQGRAIFKVGKRFKGDRGQFFLEGEHLAASD
eukprot:3616716-Lingulodinium_polyedra.AAC.1